MIEKYALLSLIFTYSIGQLLQPGSLLENIDTNWTNDSIMVAKIVILIVNSMVLIGYILIFISDYIHNILIKIFKSNKNKVLVNYSSDDVF